MASRQRPVISDKPQKSRSKPADPLAKNDLSHGIKPALIRFNHAPPTVANNPVSTVSKRRGNGPPPSVRGKIALPKILTTTFPSNNVSSANVPRSQSPIAARPMMLPQHHDPPPQSSSAPLEPARRRRLQRAPVRPH
ncbi:unnamed protein product [Rotaria sordida]|uniref:Uncharacterized protein n=1 Tax=Rotaria sordida TaxID=392033 RepID=A0A819MT62_9BILA|nr:unnamed protein product [Rotaria sordida]CAF3984909.1 unnamed protein product [Rotaria sordida]